jgi:hypothetical protein
MLAIKEYESATMTNKRPRVNRKILPERRGDRVLMGERDPDSWES